MSETTLEKALRHTLKVEGEFVDHPADPGGATKYGITQKTLSDWLGRKATKDDVKNMEWSTAKEIYKANYWDKVRGSELPPALAVLTFDVAVNSGIKNAVRNLQRALNIIGSGLVEDGLIGPATVRAAHSASETQTKLESVIDEFVVKRGIFYSALDTFGVFGLGWARRLVSTARLAYAVAAEQFSGAGDTTPEASARAVALERLDRYFLNNGVIQTYGSFFRLWDGWATAAHVYTEMGRTVPDFATGDRNISPGFLDVALFGTTLPPSRPPEPVEGQQLLAIGFPAGSSTPAERHAEVYLRRSSESFIARITQPHEPVVVGMSGGIVVDKETAEPVGVIVVRNSPADLDRDGVKDESFDFVALSDVYDAIKGQPVG